ncbi:MAG: hydroxyethylthiazole kinase [Desulfobacterales bacterium]
MRGNARESLFSWRLLKHLTTRAPGEWISALGISDEIISAARQLAAELNCIVAISGAEDIITNGKKTFQVKNGQPLMTKVTGIGCVWSAVVGAFCAVCDYDGDLLSAIAAAFGFYGLCGDLAIKVSNKPGSFFTAFLDALYDVQERDIQEGLRVMEVE